MLYFDQVDAKRFGTIRQQFWALAHFPFHTSLVLLLEGTSRFVTWRNATEMIDYLATGFGKGKADPYLPLPCLSSCSKMRVLPPIAEWPKGHRED